MAKQVKYSCRGVKGFISRASYRKLSSSKRKQCRIILSKGRPRRKR